MILKLEQKQKTDRKVFALVVAQWVTEQVAAGQFAVEQAAAVERMGRKLVGQVAAIVELMELAKIPAADIVTGQAVVELAGVCFGTGCSRIFQRLFFSLNSCP